MNTKDFPNGIIYLSGSMEFAPDGQLGIGWRNEISPLLRARGYFPINISELDIAYAEEHGDLTIGEEFLQRKSDLRRHFVYADLRLIEHHTDALIVVYDEGVQRGAGTISECQVAFNNDIPVLLVNTFGDDKYIPGWLTAITTRIFNNFNELFEYIDQLPPRILTRDRYGNHCSGDHYLCSLCGDAFQKNKHHFVSRVSPTYCKDCVEVVNETHETNKDRYEFFIEYLEDTKEH